MAQPAALFSRFYTSLSPYLFLLLIGFALAPISKADATALVSDGFVGSEACIDCHEDQTKAWQGSHHDMAMKHADEDSVLADFNNATLEFEGETNRFYRKGEEYWVHIKGADGQFADYKISYTFAFEPLQQYMVEFSNGHIQLIPFAWDSRSKEEGGQRWFHLYPDFTPTDEFYWTNAGQNWNFMCADCHSTNLKKNYESETNTYNTTWSEINVGCEACHGPGQNHLDWANTTPEKALLHMGFDRDLSKAVSEWTYQEGMTTLQPKEIVKTDQVQMCAQCHSRRTQLNEDKSHVKGSFFDRYRLSLVAADLYYHDGQIYDEDYVYGSFLQSQMAEKGVTCTNCHDPHSATLKIPEEAVCSQCHIASEYTPETHTFHAANSEASMCTSCHMPETTYMQVDPRRDHSWHVPRPDLSKHLQTPNVCTGCHEDKDNDWADKQVSEWFPNSTYRKQQPFAAAFYADAIGHQGAPNALSYVAQDATQSHIIRSSALERMAGNNSKNTLVALGRAVKHENEMIRLGAVAGSSGYPLSDRWRILEPLLTDPVLSVRAESASVLVQHWGELNPLQKEQLMPALGEYIEIQEFNSDRGFGRTNLGNTYASMGEIDKAIQYYRDAIKIEPYFENSYVNLAEVYRRQGKESLSYQVLQEGIKAQPKSSVLPYSTGLSLLRQKKRALASTYFKQAAEQAENNGQYWYVYGLSMEGQDIFEASSALEKAYQYGRNPQHLYAHCEILARNYQPGPINFAFNKCLNQLSQIAPKNVVDKLRATAGQK